MTQPMITSSTSSGATPARLTLSRTTIAPSSVAVKPFNEPKSFPTGVLTALMITASLISDILLLQIYLLFTITIYQLACQARRLYRTVYSGMPGTSVHPSCPLCLCGEVSSANTHHRDTENTEGAQRFSNMKRDRIENPRERMLDSRRY